MGTHPTLVGKRFGQLTVIAQIASDQKGNRRWRCRCDCGGEQIATTSNLQRDRTTNCGCKKSPDLTGKVFGRLTVIGRSDRRSPRGERTVPMWACRCACGAVTYKATDTLTNPAVSMCSACQGAYATEIARKSAGFVDGTQITKIRNMTPNAANTSGCRGVYYEKRIDRYRVRLKFKGRIMSFGSYKSFEEAVAVRKAAEQEYFGAFLEELGEKTQ